MDTRDFNWDPNPDPQAMLDKCDQTLDRIYDFMDNDTLAVRPHFADTQVMSFEDLIIGGVYIVHTKTFTMRFVILTAPFLTQNGWMVQTTDYPLQRDPLICLHSIEDSNVIAYDNGLWNPAGWLEVTDDAISAEQVESINKYGWRL